MTAVVAGVFFGMRLGWALALPTVRPPPYYDAVNLLVPLLLVAGGALVESAALRAGGSAGLIERLRARRLDPARPLERRLRNCVEEMAIASGLPPPSAWLLEDDAINAMAIGWSPSDAALVFTRGALERLTRAELQGVVAHELGHVAAGDMRLNTQLLGWVWGLELLWRLGLKLLWSRRERGGRSAGGLAAVGLLLLGAGGLGWVAARVLKAAAGREAEFLADARALQWTRHRDGIGGALRRIKGQAAAGRRVEGAAADAFSHCWLAEPAVDGWLARRGWLDTHPPLDERIRRLYGRAMPALPAGPRPAEQEPSDAGATDGMTIAWSAPGLTPTGRSPAPPSMGTAGPVAAGPFVSGAPARPVRLGRAAPTLLDRPEGALALLAVLVEHEHGGDGERGRGGERDRAPIGSAPADDAAGGTLRAAWRAEIARLERAGSAPWRLALLELACARLRGLGTEARGRLLAALERAADADGRLTAMEATLLLVARERLAPPRVGWRQAGALARPAEAARAAAACATLLDDAPAGSPPADARALRDAIRVLDVLPMLAKPAVVRGWQRRLAIRPHDPVRQELFGALCAAIDCPVPTLPAPDAASPVRAPAGAASIGG